MRNVPPDLPSRPQGGGINKKLLVVALVAGLAAMGLFFLYDSMKEAELKGDVVRVLRWTRDIVAGEEVTSADWQQVEISKRTFNQFGAKILLATDSHMLGQGARVQRSVSRGEYIQYAQLTAAADSGPDKRIQAGMLGMSLQVDPYLTPGNLLRVGGRADLMGLVSLKGKPAQAVMVIENLKVIGIGGVSDSPDELKAGARDQGQRIYRSVTVEVTRDVAKKMCSLLPRMEGKLWLLVRNSADDSVEFKGVNPELDAVLTAPLPDSPR